jgi:hypothetical protein
LQSLGPGATVRSSAVVWARRRALGRKRCPGQCNLKSHQPNSSSDQGCLNRSLVPSLPIGQPLSNDLPSWTRRKLPRRGGPACRPQNALNLNIVKLERGLGARLHRAGAGHGGDISAFAGLHFLTKQGLRGGSHGHGVQVKPGADAGRVNSR